ncbi:hypothetical protein HDU86_003099 [Geranomyces michiganensis]|nr:hypothetical protein HDU86_003099 [Geranomyces michiganensis]
MNLLFGVLIVIVAYFYFAAPDPGASQSSKSDGANQDAPPSSAARKRKSKKKKTAGAGAMAAPASIAPTTTGKTAASAEVGTRQPVKKETVVDAAAATRAPTPPSPTARSSETRSSTPSFLPDMDADDSEGSVSRVMRVRGPEEVAALDPEDGWQIVDVGAKKPSKPRSITIVGSSSSSSAPQPPPPSQADPSTLTKKQRENLRKAQRVKAAKDAEAAEQQQRLRSYRKEQEKAWVAKETERDKLAARERAMDRNNSAASRSTSDQVGGFAGKGIWD